MKKHQDGLGHSINHLKQKLGLNSNQLSAQSAIEQLLSNVLDLQTRVQVLERNRCYSFSIQLGDVPSAVNNWISDYDVVSTAYTENIGTTGRDMRLHVGLDRTKFIGYNTNDQIIVLIQMRTQRDFASSWDNDFSVPVLGIPNKDDSQAGFWIFLETTATSSNTLINVDGVIKLRGTSITQ